jgi:hypothetical protein
MSVSPNYRVVSASDRSLVVDYFETADDAVEACADDCYVECYVYGWGWTRWCKAMASAK